MAISEKRKEQNKKAYERWYKKHRAHARYVNERSITKRFIREAGNLDDLLELEKLFKERLNSYETKQQR